MTALKQPAFLSIADYLAGEEISDVKHEYLGATVHAMAGATGIEPDACEIGSVKFLSPAKPGDALEIRHDFQANGTIRFEIAAGMRKIASGNQSQKLL